MTLNEEANEKPGFLDYQQSSTRVFYHPQNTEDSVHPTNQEYVVVNPEEVKDPSRGFPVPAEYPETIFLGPSQWEVSSVFDDFANKIYNVPFLREV